MPDVNEFGQPVGDLVPAWSPRPRPDAVTLEGRYVVVEPLAVTHAAALLGSLCGPEDRSLWTYRATEPPADLDEMTELIARTLATPDLLTFALVPARRGAGRHRVVHADRPGHRPGRGGRRALRAVAAAHPRRDRGDPPADALRLRRPRLPPVRVEVRLAQRAVPAGGRPARLHLRGPVPAPHGDQGPQPRHRLVLGHRRRVARRTRGARALARPGELRRERRAADVPVSRQWGTASA